MSTGADYSRQLLTALRAPQLPVPRFSPIAGQIPGYWYPQGGGIALQREDDFEPYYALLPNHTRDEFLCLVRRGDVWLPLSEAGALTYTFSLGLLRDEAWVFASLGVPGARMVLLEPVSYQGLAWFGSDVQRRTHPSRKFLRVSAPPPRVTSADIEQAKTMVEELEQVSSNLEQIRSKFGLM